MRNIGIAYLILSFLTIYLYFNWYSLPYVNNDYGIKYNVERKKIGQPIVESYFVPKFKRGVSRQIWLTSDSLKGFHVHIGKHYSTTKGEITYERDFFHNSLDERLLVREYFYQVDSLVYSYWLESDSESVSITPINKYVGDSILIQWLKLGY